MRLEAARDRARTRVDDMNREAEAKIQALQDQASKAAGEAKARLGSRSAR